MADWLAHEYVDVVLRLRILDAQHPVTFHILLLICEIVPILVCPKMTLTIILTP